MTVSYEEMFEKTKLFFREQRVRIPDALRKCCCAGEGEGDRGATPIVPIALIDNM